MLIIFDFDGVLADTYIVDGEFYEWMKKRLGIEYDFFTNVMLYYEYLFDALSVPHYVWWPKVLEKMGIDATTDFIDEAVCELWYLRTTRARIDPKIPGYLKLLVDKGHILSIVAGCDEIHGLKHDRILFTGMEKYFSDIIIVGETKGIDTKWSAVKHLMNKYDLSSNETVYVDDKPEAIMEVKIKTNVKTIQLVDRRYLDKVPWMHPFRADYIVYSFDELIHLIDKISVE
mgnify:CR=1 FL=1